jgi:DoxX-like family
MSAWVPPSTGLAIGASPGVCETRLEHSRRWFRAICPVPPQIVSSSRRRWRWAACSPSAPAFAVAQPKENTHDHNGSRSSRAEMDALGRLRPERARDSLHADGCDNEAYAASHRAGDDHADRLARHECRPLGIVLLFCTALYALPQTSVLGALLLTAYLGGTVATHARIGSPIFSHMLFGVYLGVMLWGGLYLRDDRLRDLIPYRR